MHRKLFVSVITILLIVVAMVIVAAAWRRERAHYRRPVLTLPDGSKVEFLGAAMGGARFTSETKWQRLARRYLPAQFRDWLPQPLSGSIYSGSNSIAVYFRVTFPAGVSSGGHLPWSDYVAEGEDGFKYDGNSGYMTSTDAASSFIFCGLSMTSYPRRQDQFLFHLVGPQGTTLATFSVPNPAHGPFPEWKALPIPQAQTNGPVVLTLQKLSERTRQSSAYLKAEFSVQSSDPAWRSAKPSFKNLFDATGNEGQMLSSREPAWKLRALLYPGADKFVLTNLPLPGPGQFFALDQTNVWHGVSINAMAMVGPGQFSLSNGVIYKMLPPSQGTSGHSTSAYGANRVETWGSSTTFLMLKVGHTEPDDTVEIHVFDDSGREIEVTNQYDSGLNRVGYYHPTFVPPADSKSLSAMIMLNRPLKFDFMVNPADARLTDH